MSPREAAAMQCCALEQVSDVDIQEAAHYSKYAFAAYGYMLYIWSKPQYKCARARTACTLNALQPWLLSNTDGGMSAEGNQWHHLA